jgi:hypothetical protein
MTTEPRSQDEEVREVIEWECFSDPSYFDMWCVRPVGSRDFGEAVHVVTEQSARNLIDLLARLSTRSCQGE